MALTVLNGLRPLGAVVGVAAVDDAVLVGVAAAPGRAGRLGHGHRPAQRARVADAVGGLRGRRVGAGGGVGVADRRARSRSRRRRRTTRSTAGRTSCRSPPRRRARPPTVPAGSEKASKRGAVASKPAVWMPLSSRQAVSASPWPSAARSPRNDVPAGKPPRAGPPTSSTGSQAPPSRCVPVTTPALEARVPRGHGHAARRDGAVRLRVAGSRAGRLGRAPVRCRRRRAAAAVITPPCFHSAS